MNKPRQGARFLWINLPAREAQAAQNPILHLGGREPLFILGPCVIESEAFLWRIARKLKRIAKSTGVQFILKASYDKANRTSLKSFRGIGPEAGCSLLAAVGKELGIPLPRMSMTPADAEIAGKYIDVLQIPAFLCARRTSSSRRAHRPRRQRQERPVPCPWDLVNIAGKIESTGNNRYFFTERGVSFGYNTSLPTCAPSIGYAKPDTTLFSTPPTRFSARAAPAPPPPAMAFSPGSRPRGRCRGCDAFSLRLTRIRSAPFPTGPIRFHWLNCLLF